jgi:ABC-type lipoprotein release transport system permease subunit
MLPSIERHRNILAFALAALLRKKGRYGALLLVYSGVVCIVASVMFFTGSIRREAALLLTAAPDLIVQRLNAGRHDLIPRHYVTDIAKIRGVREVRPRYWGYYFDPTVKANYTVVVDTTGTYPQGSIGIGAGIARVRKLAAGDLFSLRSYGGEALLFTVQTLLPAASELVSCDLLIVHPDDYMALFPTDPAFAVDLAVSTSNPRELSTIAAKIVNRFPDTRAITRTEMLRTYDAIFDWRSGLLLAILASAIGTFAIFAWDRASGLSAEERKEIGILKGIGWDTDDVLLLKFWEGAAVSLTAFCIGTIGAILHVFYLDAPLFAALLKGWSVLYPSFTPAPEVTVLQLGTLFLCTVFPYAAATVIPSWRAATMDPDAAMRE